MRSFAFLPLFVLLFSSKGCKEKTFDNTDAAKNIQVPAYTETGANTFGATINGKAWTVFGQHFETHLLTEVKDNVLYGSITKSYYSTDSLLNVSGGLGIIQNGTETRQDGLNFSVVRKGASLVGVHYLSNGFYDDSMMFTDIDYITKGSYFSMARNPVKLIVNKDIVVGSKHIISGTFDGYLYNNFSQHYLDSVHITGGVFDIDLSTVTKQ